MDPDPYCFCLDPYCFCLDLDPYQSSVCIRIRIHFLRIRIHSLWIRIHFLWICIHFFADPHPFLQIRIHFLRQSWEFLIGFLSESLIFLQKTSDSLRKNKQFANLLIFGEQIAHDHSFLVSDLSDLLTLLMKKREWWAICSHCLWKKGNERIAHFFYIQKTYQKIQLQSNFFSKSLIRSFIMSDLSKLLTFAHLTWAIPSRLFF